MFVHENRAMLSTFLDAFIDFFWTHLPPQWLPCIGCLGEFMPQIITRLSTRVCLSSLFGRIICCGYSLKVGIGRENILNFVLQELNLDTIFETSVSANRKYTFQLKPC